MNTEAWLAMMGYPCVQTRGQLDDVIKMFYCSVMRYMKLSKLQQLGDSFPPTDILKSVSNRCVFDVLVAPLCFCFSWFVVLLV